MSDDGMPPLPAWDGFGWLPAFAPAGAATGENVRYMMLNQDFQQSYVGSELTSQPFGSEHAPPRFVRTSPGPTSGRPPRFVRSSHQQSLLGPPAEAFQQPAALPAFRDHHQSSLTFPSFQGSRPGVVYGLASHSGCAQLPPTLAQSLRAAVSAHQSAATAPVSLPTACCPQWSPSENLPATEGFSFYANSDGMAQSHAVDPWPLFGPQPEFDFHQLPTCSPTMLVSGTSQTTSPAMGAPPRPFTTTAIAQSRHGVLPPMPFRPRGRQAADHGQPSSAVVSTGGPFSSAEGSRPGQTMSLVEKEPTIEVGDLPMADDDSLGGLLDATFVDETQQTSPTGASTEAKVGARKPGRKPRKKKVCKSDDRFKCRVCAEMFLASTVKKYLRHVHICLDCMLAPSVTNTKGEEVRYCQLCKGAHPLRLFTGEQVSCSKALSVSRERKRLRQQQKQKKEEEEDDAVAWGLALALAAAPLTTAPAPTAPWQNETITHCTGQMT